MRQKLKGRNVLNNIITNERKITKQTSKYYFEGDERIYENSFNNGSKKIILTTPLHADPQIQKVQKYVLDAAVGKALAQNNWIHMEKFARDIVNLSKDFSDFEAEKLYFFIARFKHPKIIPFLLEYPHSLTAGGIGHYAVAKKIKGKIYIKFFTTTETVDKTELISLVDFTGNDVKQFLRKETYSNMEGFLEKSRSLSHDAEKTFIRENTDYIEKMFSELDEKHVIDFYSCFELERVAERKQLAINVAKEKKDFYNKVLEDHKEEIKNKNAGISIKEKLQIDYSKDFAFLKEIDNSWKA